MHSAALELAQDRAAAAVRGCPPGGSAAPAGSGLSASQALACRWGSCSPTASAMVCCPACRCTAAQLSSNPLHLPASQQGRNHLAGPGTCVGALCLLRSSATAHGKCALPPCLACCSAHWLCAVHALHLLSCYPGCLLPQACSSCTASGPHPAGMDHGCDFCDSRLKFARATTCRSYTCSAACCCQPQPDA